MSDFGIYDEKLKGILENLACKLTKDDILILGGDNYYPNGTHTQKHVDTMFRFFSIIPNEVKIYSCLGNHDHLGNIHLQMRNPRITIPGQYYTINHNQCNIYFIDTSILDDCRSGTAGNEMLLWLHNNLVNDKREKIMVGHHPIATCCAYKGLYGYISKLLMPLMVKYNINYYLCGHDHSSQHFTWIASEFIEAIKRNRYTDSIYGTKLAHIYHQIQKELVDDRDMLYHQVLAGAVIEVYPSCSTTIDAACVLFDTSVTGNIGVIDTDNDIIKFVNMSK